jgi:uncharacterized protein (TIGR00730 family)
MAAYLPGSSRARPPAGAGRAAATAYRDPRPDELGLESLVPESLSSVCVYCGSSPGVDPGFRSAAASLGRLLARRGLRLVYWGGHVGLMGVVADAALGEGGEVHGVITRALEEKEIAHRGLTTLTVVETMHERKAAMADLADSFLLMPGGFGTLDEFFEAVTWTQLGVHAKPCGALNVNGFFDPLLALFARATEQRFLIPEHRDLVIVEADPALMIDRLRSWVPVTVDKWLDRSER